MRTRINFQIASCWIICSALLASPAVAADWMFQRSYFSHAAGPGQTAAGLPQSRSAYREPFVGAHRRFAVRGGFRYNNIIIQNGMSTDRTFLREAWGDVNY